MTKSVKDNIRNIRDGNFNTTKLYQLKIDSNSWKIQLDKLFSKNITESISQYLKLQEGDAVFLAIGNQNDAVSIKVQFLIILNMVINISYILSLLHISVETFRKITY